MLKLFLALTLAIPLCGHCQSYADSPFYRKVSDVPSTARFDGWVHGDGGNKANGIVIERFISMPWSSPDRDELRPWFINSWMDQNKAAHIYHLFIQYDGPNVTFGYDLHVEPVQGTDEIRCTFSALTDPDDLSDKAWRRHKDIPVLALPGDLTPLVIKSGGAIAITMLPLGQGRIPVVQYLRPTRTDLAPASTE
jgi:hypothetical protein